MARGADTPAPSYRAADLARRLATDPRVAEQGLELEVVGRRVFVRGRLSGPDCRAQVAAVLAEAAPDLELVDEVECVDMREPDGAAAERLS